MSGQKSLHNSSAIEEKNDKSNSNGNTSSSKIKAKEVVIIQKDSMRNKEQNVPAQNEKSTSLLREVSFSSEFSVSCSIYSTKCSHFSLFSRSFHDRACLIKVFMKPKMVRDGGKMF